MPFPTELPRSAISVVLDAFKAGPSDAGRLALAVYELVGYGAFLAFGDVKHLMNFDPAAFEKIVALLKTLKFDDLPKYAEVVQFVLGQLDKGYGGPRIALSVLVKYGPAVAKVVAQIVLLIKGL